MEEDEYQYSIFDNLGEAGKRELEAKGWEEYVPEGPIGAVSPDDHARSKTFMRRKVDK